MSSYPGYESFHGFDVLTISKSMTEFNDMEFVILFFKWLFGDISCNFIFLANVRPMLTKHS